MDRPCAGCGKPLKDARSDAKTCSEACRKRVQRQRSGGGEAAAAPPKKKAEALAPWPTPVADAALAELTKHDRHETWAGQHALALAVRMNSPYETGSALASVSKQLSAAMAEALEGVTVQATDLMDELASRRDQKRGA